MALEIYWGSGSPYAWSVLLALQLKHLPYESHLLEFSKKEHKTPEMFRMNPRGKIPVLRDGDFVVYESLAILYYLEQKTPEPMIFGKTAVQKAKIMQMASEIMSYFQRSVMETVGPFLFDKVEVKEDKIRSKAKVVHEELKYFEGLLQKSPWLSGEKVCAADLLLFPHIQLMLRGLGKEAAKPFDLGFLPFSEKYPQLGKWMKQIEKIPGYEKTYPPHWKNN